MAHSIPEGEKFQADHHPAAERRAELILASNSPRRSLLLQQAGYRFKVVPANADETDSEQLTPLEVVQLNAYRKARAVAKRYPDYLVLGADTVVVLGNRVYGKPGDLMEAQRMLTELQGKTHRVITGVCLLHLRSHQQHLFSESSRVTFLPLTAAEIAHYLAQINPLDKAGAYAIQDHGDLIVKELQGSRTNVIGLPMEKLAEELKVFRMR